jgi:hypothetical protein
MGGSTLSRKTRGEREFVEGFWRERKEGCLLKMERKTKREGSG